MAIKKIIKNNDIFFENLIFSNFAKPNIVGNIKYER